MSFTDVMYGPLGQVNNQFQNNLGQNAAMSQGQQAAMAQQQQAMAAQQAQLAALYGPQGFGGQTAQYAAAGADYGRQTGGFGGYGGMNDPMSPEGGYNSIDQNDPANIALYYKLMGMPQPGGGGVNFPQAPDPAPPAVPPGQVDWNSYFSGLTAPAAAQPAYNPFSQYSNGGYNPYSPQTFAPSAQPNVGGGLAMLPGGGVDPHNANNIALYYQLMGGGGMMASGGDQSWFGAGGTNNSYNPFGQINSGQVGQYDPFGGYQAPADFNSRFGQIPGQPYGPGYFDQTFGAANSQPQAYNPFMGGYPGRLPSAKMATQQQRILDLYKTLGIIDNAGEQYGATYKNPFVNLPGS